MRSQGQGLMATLMMFVPLLAVPFVATFGVPWLAAKAKNEGLPVPEFSQPALTDIGVGQSHTARHKAEDLFAPVLEPPAVDLRLSPAGMAETSPPATMQNPHLRNASLVVSHNEGWVDPFAELKEFPEPQAQPPARQTANTTNAAPQKALEGWMLKETANEPAQTEAPLPQEFPEATAEAIEEQPPAAGSNPFAASDAAPAPVAPQVPIGANAFEDPVFEPPADASPDSFDASRTLFNPATESAPAEAPQAARQTAEMTPPAVTAQVASNTPSAVEQYPEPLTWETAQARLKDYGITRFYLQPDTKREMFLFRCAYSPAGNARINRVFEAEDRDPLEAVRKVLAQLETLPARESASVN